jgi:hypothetical protein
MGTRGAGSGAGSPAPRASGLRLTTRAPAVVPRRRGAPDVAYGYHVQKRLAREATLRRREGADGAAGQRRKKRAKPLPRVLRPLTAQQLAERARKRWKDA